MNKSEIETKSGDDIVCQVFNAKCDKCGEVKEELKQHPNKKLMCKECIGRALDVLVEKYSEKKEEDVGCGRCEILSVEELLALAKPKIRIH